MTALRLISSYSRFIKYMGGLALMVISQTNLEFLPKFMSTLWII